VDRSAIRPPKPQLVVRASIDLEALLMYRAVVSPTQEHQVRERRGTTLRPVMDVVTLPKTHATPREATAAVAVVEGAPQSRRDRPRTGADFDNPSLSIVPHDHPARVARQALGRSSWNACAVLEHGLTRCIRVFQDLSIDVDDDLKALSRSARIELVTQGYLGEQLEGVSLLLLHCRRLDFWCLVVAASI
jgi:hypothetical protein